MNDSIKHFIIDSKKRTSGSSHDFTIEFQDAIKNAKKATLEMVQIPSTFYNVRQNYNIIQFNEGGGVLNAIIPDGNYTISDLQTEIKTQMEAVGALTYTVTYSNITMKLTILGSGAFELLNSNTTNKLYVMLGYDAVDTGSAVSHTSVNVVNLANPRYIKIRIRELGISSKWTDKDTATFIINLEENRGSYNLNTINNYYQQCTISNCNITDMHVRLFDEDDRLLNLNNGEWYMVLRIE